MTQRAREINESWCIFTFCPRKGPKRGDPDEGLFICEIHWNLVTKELQGKAENYDRNAEAFNEANRELNEERFTLLKKIDAIKTLNEPFIEWGGPQGTSYRVRPNKHPELQKYVSELTRVLYGLSA